MNCDLREERYFGRRHRFRFASGEVNKLQRAFRGNSKSRGYTVLTFAVQGRCDDMLENLSYTDSDRVLHACRAMGFSVSIDETADVMLKDIEKRGWWINPFRTDDLGGTRDSRSK